MVNIHLDGVFSGHILLRELFDVVRIIKIRVIFCENCLQLNSWVEIINTSANSWGVFCSKIMETGSLYSRIWLEDVLYVSRAAILMGKTIFTSFTFFPFARSFYSRYISPFSQCSCMNFSILLKYALPGTVALFASDLVEVYCSKYLVLGKKLPLLPCCDI